MKLLHSYVAARRRDSGKVEILEEAWSLATGGDLAEVARCHEALRESDDAHAVFSHGLFVVENVARAAYEFADPAEAKAAAEAEHRSRLLADLRAAQERASAADAAAAQAEAARTEVARIEAALNPSAPEAVADASGATSLLEHVSHLPAGASLALTPPPHPPRLADGVDLSEPSKPDAGTQTDGETSTEGEPSQAPADAPADAGTPGGLDLASAARARNQQRRR